MNVHTPINLAETTKPFELERAAKRRRLIVAGVAALIVIGLALFFLRGGKPAPTASEAATAIPRVTVVVPGRVPVADEVRVTGSIAARRDMPVGVQGEGGMVTAVLVEAGDYVRAGQVLARLDRAVQAQQVNQLQAAVVQARADAALAQAELNRAQALVARGFISKADIDRRTATRDGANARVNVAIAQLREAQARLARLDVRAPNSGLVLERSVEPGQVVSPASGALFRVAENGAMEMRGRVAEQDMPSLTVGQKATVQLVGSPRQFEGDIWLLEPVIDPQSRQGEARIALVRDPLLRVGAFANARIAVGSSERPVLPQSAVMSDDQGSFVYVVGSDNKTVRRSVTVGTINAQGLTITDGLDGSERIVLTAGAFLRPGEKIEPVMAKAR